GVTADGSQVIAGQAFGGSTTSKLVRFNRDPATGKLDHNVLVDTGVSNFAPPAFSGDSSYAPPGLTLPTFAHGYCYVAGSNSGTGGISVFRTGPSSADATQPYKLTHTMTTGEGGTLIHSANAVAANPEFPSGQYLYVLGSNDNALTVFQRAAGSNSKYV